MALTEAQIISALSILGLPVRTDLTYALAGQSNRQLLLDSEICRTALSHLEAEQETEVTGIISQWTAVKFETDTIDAQGLKSDPAKTRARCKALLAQVIGYFPPSSAMGLKLQRG